MSEVNIPRIVIAGTNSGVGKTTIVTGLLAVLQKRGLNVQSYKVGPDYIDPGYHQLASGKPAHNLDTWLVPSEKILPIFAKTALGNDFNLIEGVMGLYDGGRNGISSTAAIAKLLNAPVILVVDVKSMGESAAAIVLGYKSYDPEVNIVGVILNRVGSDTHKQIVCDAIEKIGVPVLGSIFRNEGLKMPERHLGLTPVTEHSAQEVVECMCKQVAAQVDVEKILSLAQAHAKLNDAMPNITNRMINKKVRIGVAQDEAFSFYYPASLDVLEKNGAELITFSPLKDTCLPPVDGVILGGGFPEMFVEQLTANTAMRQSLLAAGQSGMPIYAECGGFMYLCRQIVDFTGKYYDMVGLVPAVATMQQKLQTVGYVQAAAVGDNILCQANEALKGHEFHFSETIPDNENFPWAFNFTKMRTGKKYVGGYAAGNVLASYLHMHFAGNEDAARNLISCCQKFKMK